jgi:hypothetical protein
LGFYLTLVGGVGMLGAAIVGFEAQPASRAAEGTQLVRVGASRLRWAVLGLALGVAGTLAAATFIDNDEPSSSSLFSSYPDLNDASKVADKWAAEHTRSGERPPSSGGCEADGGVVSSYFVCWRSFDPTGRRVTIYMQTAAPHGKLEATIVKVRRGRHRFPQFP